MLIGFIPGDREETGYWMGKRIQGHSVRGGDDEGGKNGDGAQGEDSASWGNNYDADMVVEKEMGDKRFEDGSSSTGRRRDLCFGESRYFKTPCNPGGRGGETLVTSEV